jgi:hypothetical protein
MARRLQLGDVVREHEGCHTGRVIMLFGHGTESTTVRVQWEIGWKSDIDHRDLTLVRKANEPPFEPDARIVWEDQ